MSEDLNKLREPYIVARVNWQEDNGDDHQRAVTLGDDLAVTSHHYVKALERRLQAAEERAEKAEIDLAVIHRAAQHCCGRFGGRMSEVDRIFQEITRVSSMHKTRAALKTEGA